MRKNGWGVLIGLALVAINGPIIVWRMAGDQPPPQVVPVAIAPHAPPPVAAPAACLAASDRPYFGLLDYRPVSAGTSVAVVDGSLVDLLDLLCGCPAEEIGAVEQPDEEATRLAALPRLFPQPDFSTGGIVPALLLADARGEMMPAIIPPPSSTDFPAPRQLDSPEGPAKEDASRPGKSAPVPQFGVDCAFPAQAPAFPWDGLAGTTWGPACCKAPRCRLFSRLRAWLHNSFHKTCAWENCCGCDFGCQCLPGPSAGPWGCATCADTCNCASSGPRGFGSLHRQPAPVANYADPLGNYSPMPIPSDGGMSSRQGG
jgi:hypothetical protein